MTDWVPITQADMIEGELLESPLGQFANRMRPLNEGFFEIEVHVASPSARIRLPFTLDELPMPITEANEWHYEDTGERGYHGQKIDRMVVDSVRKRWFEQVGDETHMLMKVLP